MQRVKMSLLSVLLSSSALLVGGCTQYYKVSDPSTGKVYITKEIKQEDGATKLLDAKTGSKVTIQNSEVKPITQEEFDTLRAQK